MTKAKGAVSAALGVGGVAICLLLSIGSAASAAGGTTLCKVEENPCSAANHYPIGTELRNTSMMAEFLTTTGNVVCSKSAFQLETKTTSTGSNASSVELTIPTYFFSGCRIQTPSVDDSCTVTVLNGPYVGVIAHTTGASGTLSIKSSGAGNMAAKVDCGAGLLRCEFNFGTPSLEVLGAASWSYTANRVALSGTPYEGGVCPKEATWWGVYSSGPTPTALYVESST